MASLEAFYLPTPRGRRFCLLRRPDPTTVARGAMLYLHPFAEEMNKTRRMAAVGAEALSHAGWTVLSLDCGGAGDSEGDFSDADWDGWVADALDGVAWLQADGGTQPWLWGLRAGALIAGAVAERVEIPGVLLWQPVLSGRQHLNQFLRLKVAGGALAGTTDRGSTQSLRERALQGQSIEVAGYTLSPGMVTGLDQAAFRLPAAVGRVVWGEVSSAAEPALTPVSRQHVTNLEAAGVSVDAFVARGPGFWQTVEIEEAPELVSATIARLSP